MPQTYPRDPNSLDVLKRYLDPQGRSVSENVLEADPELDLPLSTTNATQDSNDRLKRLLGLGPSPALDEQRRELADRDRTIGAAYTQTDPQVEALHARDVKEKLELAGEPGRVAGENALAVEKQKQAPLLQFMDREMSGTPDPSKMQFRPTVSEGGVSFSGVMPDKLNQQEQAMVDSAHQITALGLPLLQKYEAKYPGISTDPRKYGSPLSDTLTEKLGKGIYSFGGMTDNDALMQDAAAIQAWGVKALASGRITKPIMDMISAHLPQPGFSPGANYDRLRRLITDVLPAQLEGIQGGRGTGAMVLPTPTDPYANPDYQPR